MPISDIFKTNELRAKIIGLESTIESLNRQLSEKENELSRQRSIISQQSEELKKLDELSSLKEFVSSHLPLFDSHMANIHSNFEQLQKLWADTWGFSIHDEPYQIERQDRACDKCYTPLSLDVSTSSGCFRGRESDYSTTLVWCSCTDFQRRALPCKHIYRLAHEFDVFILDEVQVDPDINEYPHLSDLVRIVDCLSLSSRSTLRDAISNRVVVENRSFVQPLLKLNLVVISNDKSVLLDGLNKDDLFNLLPDDCGVKKSTKKSDLVNIIINEYPDIIDNLEKLKVPIELSPRIYNLRKYILRYL